MKNFFDVSNGPEVHIEPKANGYVITRCGSLGKSYVVHNFTALVNELARMLCLTDVGEQLHIVSDKDIDKNPS